MGDLPRNWTCESPHPGVAATVASDPCVCCSGRRSLRAYGGSRGDVIACVTARCAGVEPGATYEFEAYCRVEGVPSLHKSIWARVSWFRGIEDTMPHNVLVRDLSRDGEWWCLSARMQAPEAALLADVSLGFCHAPGGRVWWDDVSLHRVSSPAPRPARLATSHLPKGLDGPKQCRWALELAGEGGADAVCLTEFTQIIPTDRDPRPSVPGGATDALGEFARRYQMVVIASLHDWQGELRYNTAVIIGRDGGLLGCYRKTHIPHGEMLDGTSGGSTLPVFQTDLGTVGLQVCYDHMFPEVARALALQGAEIIFTPIMGDIRTNCQAYEAVARARAIDNGIFYVTSIQDVGRSLIIDPTGTILADSVGTPGVVFADVDLNAPYYEP